MTVPKWISRCVLLLVGFGVAIALSYLDGTRSLHGAESGYSLDESSPTASSVAFPTDYQQQFVHYATVDCPNSSIVRQMYVNPAALDALETRDVPPSGTTIAMETYSATRGEGDRLIPTSLNNVFVREKREGWSVAPDSGEWQSAWYSPSGRLVSSSQQSCISCHTMVRDRDYAFTLPALQAAARTGELQCQATEFGTSVCR
ncbi:MAG: cytochrome P460 family protein [Cyanobacteria bacterium J06639_1]